MRIVFALALLVAIVPPAQAESGHLLTPDGVRIYFEVYGEGPQTAIVPLIHWNTEAFQAHAGEIRYVLYDPRNRGGSEAVHWSKVGVEQDLADLDAVRRYFEADQVAIIGTSYYGGLAALYAMRHPEHVSRLFMVGAIPPEKEMFWTYRDPRRAERVTEEMQAKLVELDEELEDREEFCRRWWGVQSRASIGSAEDIDKVTPRCEYTNEWPEIFNNWATFVLGSLGEWDWRDDARKLQTPALVIHGTHDLVVPEFGSREWVRTLPNSRLLVLEGFGHAPWFAHPDEMFALVETFLAGNWPADATESR